MATTVVKEKLIFFLREIINQNQSAFIKDKNFKVRLHNLPGKYYLDRVTGSYEDSLQNLLHKLMWYHSIYQLFITDENELKKIEEIIEDEPEGIYKPDPFDARNQKEEAILNSLLDEVDEIHFSVVRSVAGLLQRFSHFDEEVFKEGGYLEDSP